MCRVRQAVQTNSAQIWNESRLVNARSFDYGWTVSVRKGPRNPNHVWKNYYGDGHPSGSLRDWSDKHNAALADHGWWSTGYAGFVAVLSELNLRSLRSSAQLANFFCKPGCDRFDRNSPYLYPETSLQTLLSQQRRTTRHWSRRGSGDGAASNEELCKFACRWKRQSFLRSQTMCDFFLKSNIFA